MKFSKSSFKCTKTISKVKQYFNVDTFWANPYKRECLYKDDENIIGAPKCEIFFPILQQFAKYFLQYWKKSWALFSFKNSLTCFKTFWPNYNLDIRSYKQLLSLFLKRVVLFRLFTNFWRLITAYYWFRNNSTI